MSETTPTRRARAAAAARSAANSARKTVSTAGSGLISGSWQPYAVISGGASACIGLGGSAATYLGSPWPGLAVGGAATCWAALKFGTLAARSAE